MNSSKKATQNKRIERTSVASVPVTAKTVTGENDDSVLEYYNNYAEYSKTLRAWLVAYGIGGPILFLTNDVVAKTLANSPEKAKIIYLFLLAVSFQVALAFINKWCAWHMYAGENDTNYQNLRRYKFWACINCLSIMDLIIDAASIGAFVWSTWLALMVFI